LPDEMMKKLRTTDKVIIPKGYKVLNFVGSYAFVVKDKQLYLIGFNSIINISKAKIGLVSIMPIDKKFKFSMNVKIEHKLKDNKVYYFCRYKKIGYCLFDNLTDAYTFVYNLTEYKALALKQKLKKGKNMNSKKQIRKEIKKNVEEALKNRKKYLSKFKKNLDKEVENALKENNE